MIIPIAVDPFVIIEPAEPAAGTARIRSMDDLAKVHGIAARRGGGVRMMIERYLRQHDIEIDWDFEVQNLYSAVSLVASGLGWAIVPVAAFDSVDGSRLHIATVPSFNLNRTIYAARIERSEMNGPTKRMWTFLLEAGARLRSSGPSHQRSCRHDVERC